MRFVASKYVWRERVQAWRTSGMRAEDFCEGQEFSAGLLRHWAWRLGLTRRRRPAGTEPKQAVQLARVVVAQRRGTVAPAAGSRIGGLQVEIGGARVHVGRGFDAETLAAVLDVLARRSTRETEVP